MPAHASEQATPHFFETTTSVDYSAKLHKWRKKEKQYAEELAEIDAWLKKVAGLIASHTQNLKEAHQRIAYYENALMKLTADPKQHKAWLQRASDFSERCFKQNDLGHMELQRIAALKQEVNTSTPNRGIFSWFLANEEKQRKAKLLHELTIEEMIVKLGMKHTVVKQNQYGIELLSGSRGKEEVERNVQARAEIQRYYDHACQKVQEYQSIVSSTLHSLSHVSIEYTSTSLSR